MLRTCWLTFLVSFASSLTSPDLFFDSAVAFFTDLTASCAVSITTEVVDARRPDRRGSGMSVPSGGGAALRGMTNGCFSGGDTNRKQRSRKGLKWESNRRANHMAALLATRVAVRRRHASCLLFSCSPALTLDRAYCFSLHYHVGPCVCILTTRSSLITHLDPVDKHPKQAQGRYRSCTSTTAAPLSRWWEKSVSRTPVTSGWAAIHGAWREILRRCVGLACVAYVRVFVSWMSGCCPHGRRLVN
jgi:hypothetical protein